MKNKENLVLTIYLNQEEKRMKDMKKMILAALFLAMGMILPFFTGQIPAIGSRLLPMHIPVLLCGFVCGWQYGLTVGIILPIFRSLIFTMPKMMPTAVAMAFELAVYGAVAGILYAKLPKKKLSVYISLITAMFAGRVIWGVVSIPLYGITGGSFSTAMFIAGAFTNAIPGIILQIVAIPAIIIALTQIGVLKNERENAYRMLSNR